MHRRLRSRAAWVACVLMLSTAACTNPPIAPEPLDPGPAADRFLDAWTERDYLTMWSMLDARSRHWTPSRIEGALTRALRSGNIRSFEASRIEPYPDEVGVRGEQRYYEIVYRLPGQLGEIALKGGVLGSGFDTRSGEWRFFWRPHMMWPGIPGAKAFSLKTRFRPRAPIVDRDGRKLAAGATARRRYPFGSLAGATIGHLEPLLPGDIPRGDLHDPGDLAGASGLEEAFDARIAGTPAAVIRVVDKHGKVLEVLARQRAHRGKALHTTLDVDVQRAAQAAFGSTTGGAVVLDPRSGDILAAVSSSPFDPTNYVGVAGIEPFNRALSGLYPPGSSLKVMTASAALDTKTFKTSSILTGPADYKGVRNFESGEFGTLTFAEALKFSVNTAFAQIAEKLGPRRLTRYARRFGFNREPATAMDAARPSFPPPLDEGDLLWGSIGQAQVLATPLQMATIAATIANGGRRMEPRIARHEPRRGRRVVSAKVAGTMTALMEDVVRGGTGVGAQIAGVRVAGKTGTAEVDIGGQRLNHAWFISFAPANDPKVTVAVVSEYGGVGGRVAAPIARAILAAVLPVVR